MMHMRSLTKLSLPVFNRSSAFMPHATIASRVSQASIGMNSSIQVRTFMQRKGFRPRSDRWKLLFFGSTMGLAVSVYANYHDMTLIQTVNENEWDNSEDGDEPRKRLAAWPNPASHIKIHPAPEKNEKKE